MLNVDKTNTAKNRGKTMFSKMLLIFGMGLTIASVLSALFIIHPNMTSGMFTSEVFLIQSIITIIKSILPIPLAAICFLGSIAARLNDW